MPTRPKAHTSKAHTSKVQTSKTHPPQAQAKKKPAVASRRQTESSFDDSPIGSFNETNAIERPGPGSAGQSGDTQGLTEVEEASSESVLELVEEGQAFEAGIVAGIENAPDADAGPVHTREVLEDDVPREYDEEEFGDQR